MPALRRPAFTPYYTIAISMLALWSPGFRLARIEIHGKLIGPARDDASLVLARDPTLASPRGKALRHLLYLFERDEAIRLIRAG